MRIKRSHLDSLNFVVGTLLTCFLVVSVSSNLQAHPTLQILDQKGQPIENFSVKPKVSACERLLVASDDVATPLPVEREIASALEPYAAPVTESVEMVMDDECAREKTAVPALDEEDTESLNALLEMVESAVNFQKPITACEDVDPVFDIPAELYTHSIAAN